MRARFQSISSYLRSLVPSREKRDVIRPIDEIIYDEMARSRKTDEQTIF